MSWLGWNGGEWLEEEGRISFSTYEGMEDHCSFLYWQKQMTSCGLHRQALSPLLNSCFF